MELIKVIFIFINFFHLINTAHNSFKNECGPYKGLDDTILMPKKEDCLKENTDESSTEKCCYVEGEQNLIKRTACVLLEDETEERIKIIQDLNEIATKLNVDCGKEKKFESDCGINEQKEKSDCFGDPDINGKCCFIKISSPHFEGQGCKKFESISLNDIGEAVVAAQTIDAELEVECGSCFLIINLKFLILLIFCFLLRK